MDIKIISVGKIKEKYFTDAIKEYEKRLSRYCKLSFIQVNDEKTPDQAPDAVNRKILAVEGEKILKQIRDQEYVIALAIDGKMLNSVALANQIQDWGIHGISHLTFVIGGSLGLSPNVMKRSDYQLSFSKMTFPHQLMKVILMEQIYRSYRIISGEPYHK